MSFQGPEPGQKGWYGCRAEKTTTVPLFVPPYQMASKMKEVPVLQSYQAVRRIPQRQYLKLSFRGRTVPYLLLRGRVGTISQTTPT